MAESVIVLRTDQSIAYLNDSAARLTGWAETEAYGLHWTTVLHMSATARGLVAGALSADAVDVPPLAVVVSSRNSADHVVQLSVKPLELERERFQGWLFTLSATTASDGIKFALRESERRLDIAYDRGQTGIWDWDPNRDVFHEHGLWVGKLRRNCDGNVIPGENLLRFTHPADVPKIRNAMREHLGGRTDFYEIEHRVQSLDGDYVRFLARGQVVERDATGRALRLMGTYTDITALKAQAERLEAMLEGARLLICEWDIETDEIHEHGDWRPEFMHHAGGTQLTMSRLIEHIHPDDRESSRTALLALLRGETSSFDVDQRVQRKDGGYYDFIVRGKIVERDAAGRGQRMVTIYTDVTHSRTRARLVQIAQENGRQGAWEWRPEEDHVFFSREWYAMLGYPVGSLRNQRHDVQQILHPDDKDGHYRSAVAMLKGEQNELQSECRYRHRDGHYIWILTRGKIYERDADGRATRVLGTDVDISALKETQFALEQSQSFLELIIDTVPQWVFWQDREFHYLGCNQRFAELAGFSSPAELIGKKDSDLWWARHAPDFYQQDNTLLDGTTRKVQNEVEFRGHDGRVYWLEVTKVAMRDAAGKAIGVLGAIHDVSERKRAEAEAQHLALFDALTDLPNRRYLSDRLEACLASASRHGICGALLFIDMDQFKQVNDTLGHSVGDALLQAVAQRLTNVTRQEDTVARLGGDEFVVLLPELAGEFDKCAQQAQMVSEKIHTSLTAPFQVEHHKFHVTPTIGITLFPERGQTVDDVLKEADTAMYAGKASGRNVTRFFRPEMEESAKHQRAMEAELRGALARKEFELYFQPQVGVHGEPAGVEVLLRWNHPQHGLVSPAEFIPVAEERGLIVDIGCWIFDSAFETFRRWMLAGYADTIDLGINISLRQFRNRNFVDDLSARIKNHQVPPDRIVLELTEGTVIEDVGDTIEKMDRLRDLGLRFALDDFGAGYSSLGYLKRLPIDQLKIDRSFIAEIGKDPNDEVICQTIIAMGKHLGLHTIAEGVETTAQLDFLRRNQCNGFQGFLFLHPSREADFLRFLRSGARV